jgi:hypothetical protein
MYVHYRKIVRHYDQLPRQWRIIVTTAVLLIMFSQALQTGETLGKTLYYLTH